MRDWMDEAPAFAFSATRHVKAARKEHACSGCRERILAGKPYARTSYVEDGKFGVCRFHVPMCPRDLAEYEREARAEAEAVSRALRSAA